MENETKTGDLLNYINAYHEHNENLKKFVENMQKFIKCISDLKSISEDILLMISIMKSVDMIGAEPLISLDDLNDEEELFNYVIGICSEMNFDDFDIDAVKALVKNL